MRHAPRVPAAVVGCLSLIAVSSCGDFNQLAPAQRDRPLTIAASAAPTAIPAPPPIVPAPPGPVVDCLTERAYTWRSLSTDGRSIRFKNQSPCLDKVASYVFALFRINRSDDWQDQTLIDQQSVSLRSGSPEQALAFRQARGCYQTDFYGGVTLTPGSAPTVDPLAAFITYNAVDCPPPPPVPPLTPQPPTCVYTSGHNCTPGPPPPCVQGGTSYDAKRSAKGTRSHDEGCREESSAAGH